MIESLCPIEVTRRDEGGQTTVITLREFKSVDDHPSGTVLTKTDGSQLNIEETADDIKTIIDDYRTALFTAITG